MARSIWMVVLLAQKNLYRSLFSAIWSIKKLFFDSKTILQERIQAHCEEALHYELIHEEGPDHQKIFIVQAMLGDKIIGKGQGRTKKAAEQEAAYHALTGKDTCI